MRNSKQRVTTSAVNRRKEVGETSTEVKDPKKKLWTMELQCRCFPSYFSQKKMIEIKAKVSDLCFRKLKSTSFHHFRDCPKLLVEGQEIPTQCGCHPSVVLRRQHCTDCGFHPNHKGRSICEVYDPTSRADNTIK
ncbi:hypothetical protein Droror1_Dr00004557 [Drosera rotundifolia]